MPSTVFPSAAQARFRPGRRPPRCGASRRKSWARLPPPPRGSADDRRLGRRGERTGGRGPATAREAIPQGGSDARHRPRAGSVDGPATIGESPKRGRGGPAIIAERPCIGPIASTPFPERGGPERGGPCDLRQSCANLGEAHRRPHGAAALSDGLRSHTELRIGASVIAPLATRWAQRKPAVVVKRTGFGAGCGSPIGPRRGPGAAA